MLLRPKMKRNLHLLQEFKKSKINSLSKKFWSTSLMSQHRHMSSKKLENLNTMTPASNSALISLTTTSCSSSAKESWSNFAMTMTLGTEKPFSSTRRACIRIQSTVFSTRSKLSSSSLQRMIFVLWT